MLLTAVLRFWRLDMAEFKGDELAVTRLALALAQQGQWPSTGIPSSLGTNNSPLFVYLEALPALLWPSPLALTAFVAAINVGGVALAILLAQRYFGPAAALVAGLTFATGPWAVMFARKIWEQDLLPPVTLLFFLGLFAVVVGRKPRWLLPCGAAAGLACQLHPSAIVLPAVGGVALALWPQRFPRRYLLGGLAAGLAVAAPYLLIEARVGFADWRSALTVASGEHMSRPLSVVVAFINWFQAATGWQVFGLLAPSDPAGSVPTLASLAFGLTASLFLAAVVSLLAQTRRHFRCRDASDQAAATLLVALWLFLPPLLLGASGMFTYPHYFIVTYPAPFLAVGLLAERLWRRSARARAGVMIVGSAGGAANAAAVLLLLATVDRAPLPNAYGLPLGRSMQVASAIVAAANGRPYALTVDPALTDGAPVLAQLAAWDGAGPGHRSADGEWQFLALSGASPGPTDATMIAVVGPPGQPEARLYVVRINDALSKDGRTR